ncbi:MAG: BMP family protein [Treponema sp.]|jgi:basic membrane protein A|nr:BMP family protein [Treponema sp.]
MKKLSFFLSLIGGGLLCVALSGCSKKASPEQPAPQTQASQASGTAQVVKIALIIENTIDDKGWCQAMYDGLVQAQNLLPGRIEFSYSEKMLPVDAGSAARQYAAQGYDVIIGHGAQYKNLMLEMAEEYPHITFAFGTSAEIGPDNVFTYMPESEETGYLNGILAGLLTKTNNIGYIGPVDGGDAARYGRGFVLGIQQVNPGAKIMVAHTGSFSDFVKAGEVAHSQIRAGADILTGASQQAIGALRAVSDATYSGQAIFWLGQDVAQLNTPEGQAKCIAASSYNYAAVIQGILEKHDAGIRGGVCLPMNFSNDGFIFRYNQDLSGILSPDIRARVEEALEGFRKAPNTVNWNAVDYSTL